MTTTSHGEVGRRSRPARSGSAETDVEMVAAADGLRHLVLTLERLRHHYGELTGVGDTDTMALGNLHSAGPLGAAELANRLGITRSSVTALVDRLENAHLVMRHSDPDDRRRQRIVLTPQGEEAIQRARAWSVGALRGIEPDRLRTIAQTLDELAYALNHHADSR